MNRESRVISKSNNVINITTFWRYPLKTTDNIVKLDTCEFRRIIRSGTPDNIIYIATIE